MGGSGGISFQATCNAVSMTQSDELPILPHHPLSCAGTILRYHEDGTMECEHAVTWPNDPRGRKAVDHSLAVLLIEIAREVL